MRILPTIISGIACATTSVGAEFLFSRIQLIMRSTFHKFGCSHVCQRAVSYSIAGVAGGAIGIAVTAIACKAIAYRKASLRLQAQKYFDRANNEYNSGSNQDALPNFEQALSIFKSLDGENSIEEVARCYCMMGMAQYKLGHYQDTSKNFEKALPIFKDQHEENCPCLATCYHFIGMAQLELASYQDALEALGKALPIFKSVYGEDSKEFVGCRHSIGEAQLYLGNYQDALKSLEQALSTAENLPEASYKILETLPLSLIVGCAQLVGCVQSKLNNHQEALKYFDKVLEFCLGSTALERADLNMVLFVLIAKGHAIKQISGNQTSSWTFEQGLSPFLEIFREINFDVSAFCEEAAGDCRTYGFEYKISEYKEIIEKTIK